MSTQMSQLSREQMVVTLTYIKELIEALLTLLTADPLTPPKKLLKESDLFPKVTTDCPSQPPRGTCPAPAADVCPDWPPEETPQA